MADSLDAIEREVRRREGGVTSKADVRQASNGDRGAR
jgi:hypothetical protein